MHKRKYLDRGNNTGGAVGSTDKTFPTTFTPSDWLEILACWTGGEGRIELHVLKNFSSI
jgi:hypothetical protein